MSAARRRLYLMRHGSVSYFSQGAPAIAHTDVVLTAAGRSQADAAGAAFAAAGVKFDRVITSGLPRTRETAARVLAAAGMAAEPEAWPDLKELHAGPLDAIPVSALREAYVGTFEGVVPHSKRFAGGESIGEFLGRVLPAVRRLRDDPSWQVTLMVLHGGVNRAILSYALTGEALFLGNLSQAPGCINALDVGASEHDWVVRYSGLAPSDLLQAEARLSTLEVMLAEYLTLRRSAPPSSPT